MEGLPDMPTQPGPDDLTIDEQIMIGARVAHIMRGIADGMDLISTALTVAGCRALTASIADLDIIPADPRIDPHIRTELAETFAALAETMTEMSVSAVPGHVIRHRADDLTTTARTLSVMKEVLGSDVLTKMWADAEAAGVGSPHVTPDGPTGADTDQAIADYLHYRRN
jgi:hypothetical protein